MELEKCYLCGSHSSVVLHKGTRGGYNDINVLKCSNCGLVRLSKVMDDAEDFYKHSGMRNGVRNCIGSLRVETEQDDVRRYRFTENYLRGKSVLDFGCGDGGYLVQAKKIAAKAEGVELEDAMREQLLSEGIGCYSSIEETGSYDVITMFHVLEHLTDPLAYIAKLREHLADNGILIIEVPNADDALLSQYGSNAFADFTYWNCHIYLYTNATLRMLLRKAGMDIEFIQQVQRYPLANHLYWLSEGRPGGHVQWSYLMDANMDKAYGAKLASLGIADTILVGCRVRK